MSRLYEAGTSRREIGRIIGRSASTVGWKLRRNTLPRGGYKPALADRIALSRRRRLSRIERSSPLRSYVCDRLAMGWSPEQIAGRLKQEGSEHSISHELIYRFIYRPRLRREKLHRFLPWAKATRGRRYFKRRRDPIPGRTSIHERPRAVETREQFGHWEGDLMQFRTQRGNLLTLCERKTRFTFTAPLSKQAETTDDALREILGPLPEPARRSVTFDNGSEFALHENLNAELAHIDDVGPLARFPPELSVSEALIKGNVLHHRSGGSVSTHASQSFSSHVLSCGNVRRPASAIVR